ncbi:MAG: sulfatase-like hydrolase/transferase [Oscillospiraceae bacterium]
MVSHPVRFLSNAFIIMFTLSLSLLLKKRSFFLALFSTVWLALGIVNCILLSFRTTPLGMIDIALLSSVFSIIDVYLDPLEIVLIAVVILLVIAGLVILFIKAPKKRTNIKRAVIFLLVVALGGGGAYGLTVIDDEDTRAESFANIAQAYSDYGFVYCFCTGAVDRGISRPDGYSRVAMKKIVSGLESGAGAEETPNIIMIQLESFFDVSHLDDVSYDENPIPVFTKLERTCSTGFLTVPSVGAGTANTEFEVISGMSLDFFGMGEYPYKTILQEEACETVATNLKQLGYSAHAIHNNTGTFYDRYEVLAQLGFDTFTSIEYMQDVNYNPIGWAKDSALTGEIIKALDSTEEQDFVFTITVQGHGKYQRGVDSEEAEKLDVTWYDDADDEDAFAYYLSQLKETDEFIGELLKELEKRDEKCVVVLYGDHLPNFSIGSEQLENGDIFQTEYVIWANFPMERQVKDLSAFQLSAEVLGRLGIDSGILTKYHQQCSEDDDYVKGLELLEYDMLYGEFYCFGGENPYTATEITMGTQPITITGASWEDGVLYIRGKNFTEWSHVAVNGDGLNTQLVNGTLCVSMDEPETGDVITVRQVTDGLVTLSESDEYIW